MIVNLSFYCLPLMEVHVYVCAICLHCKTSNSGILSALMCFLNLKPA